MRKVHAFALLAGLGLGLLVSQGCARHVVHHHHAPGRKVVVLDQEHEDRTIVVVHARPGPERHCWRHGAHWHCRR